MIFICSYNSCYFVVGDFLLGDSEDYWFLQYQSLVDDYQVFEWKRQNCVLTYVLLLFW